MHKIVITTTLFTVFLTCQEFRQLGRNSPIVGWTRFLTGQARNKETIFLLRDLDLSNETVAWKVGMHKWFPNKQQNVA
jgi:hypothetical protein